MNARELEDLLHRIDARFRSRVPVLLLVPALPLDAGDKVPVRAAFDADGSLVIEVDTQHE